MHPAKSTVFPQDANPIYFRPRQMPVKGSEKQKLRRKCHILKIFAFHRTQELPFKEE
jgi:hypothetical protein